MSIAAALGSAACAGASSVLQHHTARYAPHHVDTPLRLIGHLLRRRRWLAGLLAAVAGLVLHIYALGIGQLAVVQPLLVCGLLFALPASAVLDRRRPSVAEAGWAALLVAGLAAFLLAARPSGGQPRPDPDAIATAITAGAAAAAALAGWANRADRKHRAALLGVATGAGYGLTAALLKDAAGLFNRAPLELATGWPLYALFAVGAATITLNQIAYRAGPLAASLPAITIADPVVAITIGALAFDEHLAHTPAALTAELAGFLAMTGASIVLARSAGA